MSIEVTRPRLLSSCLLATSSRLFVASTSPDRTDILEYEPSTEEVKIKDCSSLKVVSPKRPRPPSCFTPLAAVNRPKPETRLAQLKQDAGGAGRLFSPVSVAALSENSAVSMSDVLTDSVMSAANDTPSPKRFREALTDV